MVLVCFWHALASSSLSLLCRAVMFFSVISASLEALRLMGTLPVQAGPPHVPHKAPPHFAFSHSASPGAPQTYGRRISHCDIQIYIHFLYLQNPSFTVLSSFTSSLRLATLRAFKFLSSLSISPMLHLASSNVTLSLVFLEASRTFLAASTFFTLSVNSS